MSPDPVPRPSTAASGAGVWLRRTDENVAEIAALGDRLGGAVGLEGLLGDLNRRLRRSYGWFGRAVDRAWTWDAADRRTTTWWPQGISTSADASDTEDVAGRRLLVVTWYAKESGGLSQGARVTFVDIEARRYRHVLLVVPSLAEGRLRLDPLHVHTGGIAWYGPYLHVAATARGFMTCRIDDVLRIPDRLGAADPGRLGVDDDAVTAYGYRYVLPVRFAYRAVADDAEQRLRYSFLSLDRGSSPVSLVAGEYGRGEQSTRLARFALDPDTQLLATGEDGLASPDDLDDRGVVRMQGAAHVGDRWYVTVSQGPRTPGSVFVGTPGQLRGRHWATPIGPEDIAYWPSTDELWSVSEHPSRRWIYSMKRSWFD